MKSIHVEICVARTHNQEAIIHCVKQYLSESSRKIENNVVVLENIPKEIKQIKIISKFSFGDNFKIADYDAKYYLYSLNDSDPENLYMEGDDDTPISLQWEIPHTQLESNWDAIVIDEDIKHKILSYCLSSITFAKNNINPLVIDCNKIILLYGPPGTGKTTLCKAVAQKLCIHSDTYKRGVLMEINSHSLFSRWFSESGKMVLKLFDIITDIASQQNTLVCVLIDEAESLISSRSQANNEPVDSIRAVNAMLTCLDKIRRHPNVLIFCTSNLMNHIDEAFQDRCDLIIQIALPKIQAREQILRSCLHELKSRNILIDRSSLEDSNRTDSTSYNTSIAELIQHISEHTESYSGRRLRKLPLQAYAALSNSHSSGSVTLLDFLRQMRRCIASENGVFRDYTQTTAALDTQSDILNTPIQPIAHKENSTMNKLSSNTVGTDSDEGECSRKRLREDKLQRKPITSPSFLSIFGILQG